MTPKEKAKHLYDKFCNMESWCDDAKECALVAVDEIIKSNPLNPIYTSTMTQIEYWEQVKQEIEKL